jgi:hypothetical protein
MTYPPQPGQPHYGDGGQQPPQQQYPQGTYDQSGAYPQQQYPQQYPGQNQQYPQGFGGPPVPPKNGKIGLVVVIAVAVVVLLTLGITGFVAPGFLLGDDKADKAAGPETTARAIIDGINAHDKTALRALKCGNADEDIDQAIDQVDEATNATLGELAKVSETEYSVVVKLSVEGRSRSAAGTLVGEGGQWCWKEIGRSRSTTSTTR